MVIRMFDTHFLEKLCQARAFTAVFGKSQGLLLSLTRERQFAVSCTNLSNGLNGREIMCIMLKLMLRVNSNMVLWPWLPVRCQWSRLHPTMYFWKSSKKKHRHCPFKHFWFWRTQCLCDCQKIHSLSCAIF